MSEAEPTTTDILMITSDTVIAELKATSKKQVLQELAARAELLTGQPAALLFEKLLEREKLGSTGIGQGVAIPHAKIENLTEVVGLFARLSQSVDFDSVDDQPVDLVYLLLAPPNAGGLHLKALARVSRLLRDETLCRDLRGSSEAHAMVNLLVRAQDTQAA